MLNVPASLSLLRPVVQFVTSTRGTKDLQLLLKHLFISQDAVNLIFRCLVDLLHYYWSVKELCRLSLLQSFILFMVKVI